MDPCNRPGCGRGEIDDQGFCTACGLRPAAVPVRLPAPRVPGRTGANAGVAPVRPDPWWGLDLVRTGRLPEAAPAPPEAEDVSEEHRFCGAPDCGEPVGRGSGGRPGRTEGYCPRCGTRFDFSRPSGGWTVAGRYDVAYRLGAGSYGTAFLAHDRNLDTDVVLKALKRQSVARTADQERDALVGLRHDSIVRILSYEPQGPYLVLEYVPGAPLSARADDPLEVVLGHGLQILQALDYLHARGLLHCDVKPSNIIRFREESPVGPRDRVRLIDFGSVRTTKDRGPVVAYTPDYAPPKDRAGRTDPEHLRPTAGFDLYCLGMTLTELCRRHLRDPGAPGVDSLRLLLERATDTRTPDRRFVSARQFAEQLSGVIRQVVAAAPAGRLVTRQSALFGSMTEPLHGGLGAARPFGHWITAGLTPDSSLTLVAPFTAPAPQEIAAALPKPLADPDHPGVAGPAEGALAECRVALRRGEVAAAKRAFAGARLPRGYWLGSWYGGLIQLAAGDTAAATEQFTDVRRTLPGELIPRLALGLCAELRGDLPVARLHYATVFDTAPALGAAGFGLARVYLTDRRRAEAVATAVRLAQGEFRFQREGGIAAVRLLVAVLGPVPGLASSSARRAGAASSGAGVTSRRRQREHRKTEGRPHGGPVRSTPTTQGVPFAEGRGRGAVPGGAAQTGNPEQVLAPQGPDAPTPGDLARARESMAGLEVDAAAKAGLRAEIQYAEFVLAGHRLKMSDTVRDIAEHAPTERDHTALVDLANRLRPPIGWRWPLSWPLSWPRRRGRAGQPPPGQLPAGRSQ